MIIKMLNFLNISKSGVIIFFPNLLILTLRDEGEASDGDAEEDELRPLSQAEIRRKITKSMGQKAAASTVPLEPLKSEEGVKDGKRKKTK